MLAGQNPLCIRALTQEDLNTFAVRESDVSGLLEGGCLKDRLAESRKLWAIDFHTGFIDYVAKVAMLDKDTGPKKSVLYAGRCVLYTRCTFFLQGIHLALLIYHPWLALWMAPASIPSPVLWCPAFCLAVNGVQWMCIASERINVAQHVALVPRIPQRLTLVARTMQCTRARRP